MATVLLSAVGASAGSAFGGSALGVGIGALGKAAGGVAGSLVDQALLGRGAAPVETPRLQRLRLSGAGEGDPVPQIFGRMRVAGQLIWSSDFREHAEEADGGKGTAPARREHRYTVSFAMALCEGRIERIGRVWADGTEISLDDYPHRLHRGGPLQMPDPLIDALEGGAPGFRDVAYVVFEDLPLETFGNRLPQLNFEVYRRPKPAGADGASLADLVKGVALSPGSGEFALETRKVRRIVGPGATEFENVNSISERPDLLVALDQLEAESPAARAVSLVVSWFGDDLRCGACAIRPCVETGEKETDPVQWRVNGLSRGDAPLVSTDAEGRPVFGGTPSDASVIAAIREMNRRGMAVMFYPFILMDIPAGNARPDPWTGAAGQPAFPWRGRITLQRAPGVPGSADRTAAAAAEVAAFFGAAQPGDFSVSDDVATYSGPQEWSLRRFILHYAHLCAAAGGVESFCIGSELRGLTAIRSGASEYPAVARLRALAADVRAILGTSVKLGYAADWSEYANHRPEDGSNDIFFHLDPLWADPDIDFIGVDNYLPLADWRHEEGHLDEPAGSIHSLDYLRANVEGGEGFAWFYADAAARANQIRSPIVDTAHGEDWIFRVKDFRNWWSQPHRHRPAGVREAAATDWVPMSKPIRFTEIGCPAVDLGANQPNVFVDPKSSESFLPYFSRGVRDDNMQRRYLEAALGWWEDPAHNPLSPLYGGRMIETARSFVWTWDARPFPDFPNQENTWSDGPNWRLGHWITGRLGGASLADVVAELCRLAGVLEFDVSGLEGVVQGLALTDGLSGRAALQSLMTAFAFDAFESGGALRFRHRARPADAALRRSDLALSREGRAEIELQRTPDGDLPAAVSLGFVDAERDYETGATEARAVSVASTRREGSTTPVLLDAAGARDVVERQLAEIRAARDGARLAVPRRFLALEPSDIVTLEDEPGRPRYRIDVAEDRGGRALTLSRVDAGAYAAVSRPAARPAPSPIFPARPVTFSFIDAPLPDGGAAGPLIAATARPWAGPAALHVSADGESFSLSARIPRPAALGVTATDLARAAPDLFTRAQTLDVILSGGTLMARSEMSVLSGENLAAVRLPGGEWEVLQFLDAELIGADRWRLGRLLRGQAGTEWLIPDLVPAGADFVLLDAAAVPAPGALRGVERVWRIGPGHKPVSHDSHVEFRAGDSGARLRPYAPAHFRATRNPETGDVALSWVRRARTGGDGWEGLDPPLGEDREAWALTIGAREIETAARAHVWTAAEQAADGATGDIVATVAQVTDLFGRGPAARVIFHV